jgi:flagellar basal body rod protein FlgC
MADPVSIALSGARAEAVGLAASAANTANMRTRGRMPGSGDGPEPYRAVEAVRESRPLAQGGGAVASVRPADRPFVPEYDPGSPLADGSGLVAAPAVDPAAEAARRTTALAAFRAAVATARTAREMDRALIDSVA